MKNNKATILLVDDHTLILQGIKHIVSQMPEIKMVYTASSGTEALRLINIQPFDLYILDIELPDISGFELIERILVKHPEARILISTMHEEIWTLKKLKQSPVCGVVLKSTDCSELISAIQNTLKGNAYFCKQFKHLLCRKKNSNEEAIKEQLTIREIEVLQAISKGFNTREIAELFHVSNNTIESHRKNLMIKLDAKNAVDLVLKAIQYGIISLN